MSLTSYPLDLPVCPLGNLASKVSPYLSNGFFILSDTNGDILQKVYQETRTLLRKEHLYETFSKVTLGILSIEEVIDTFKVALRITDDTFIYWVLNGFACKYEESLDEW